MTTVMITAWALLSMYGGGDTRNSYKHSWNILHSLLWSQVKAAAHAVKPVSSLGDWLMIFYIVFTFRTVTN